MTISVFYCANLKIKSLSPDDCAIFALRRTIGVHWGLIDPHWLADFIASMGPLR
jgi:hypothetical protein